MSQLAALEAVRLSAAVGGEAAAAVGGEAAGAFSNILGGGSLDGVLAQNILPSSPGSNLAPSPFSGFSTGGGFTGGAGNATGFGGNFNSLLNGADPNNANSLLGIQQQADQQQTMTELAAKLEQIQKETDQFIIQNL